MRTILEELWYGNICPNTGCRESTPLAKQLMGYIADRHDNLQATLTEEQKEVLEKFDDCYAELTDINEREIFVYEFRLGARIMLEVMLPQAEEQPQTEKDHTQGFILICGLFLFASLEGVAQKFTVFRKSLSCTILMSGTICKI